jgi:hypothetical protein
MSTDFSSQGTPIPQAQFNQPVLVGDKWARISSATTTQVKTGQGYMAGITVASGSSPTLVIYDDTASTLIGINTITPNIGWNPMPFPFSKGLRITTGGTIDCTVIYL